MSSDGEDRYVEKVFTTEELAQNYIKQQNDWKPAFKKKFGVSYNRVEYFTNEMQTWVYNEYSDDCCILVVKEVVYYEDGFNMA